MTIIQPYLFPGKRSRQPIATITMNERQLSSLSPLGKVYCGFTVLTLNQMLRARTVSMGTAYALLGLEWEKMQGSELNPPAFLSMRREFTRDVFFVWKEAFADRRDNSAKSFKERLDYDLSSQGAHQLIKAFGARGFRIEKDAMLQFEFYLRAGRAGITQFEKFNGFCQKVGFEILDNWRANQEIADEYRKALWVEFQTLRKNTGLLGITGLFDLSPDTNFFPSGEEFTSPDTLAQGIDSYIHVHLLSILSQVLPSSLYKNMEEEINAERYSFAKAAYRDYLAAGRRTLSLRKTLKADRLAAAKDLKDLGERSTSSALVETLFNDKVKNPEILVEVVNALARIGTHRAIRVLQKALKHPSSKVRSRAAFHLLWLLPLEPGSPMYYRLEAYIAVESGNWERVAGLKKAAYPALRQAALEKKKKPDPNVIAALEKLGKMIPQK